MSTKNPAMSVQCAPEPIYIESAAPLLGRGGELASPKGGLNMSRSVSRVALALVLLVAGVASMTLIVMGQSTGQPSTKNGEWPHYTADLKGSRYSPLDQINGSNFNQLEIAWRFKTDHL